MKSTPLLEKLESLSARTPASRKEIKELFESVTELLRHHFNAYCIDIVWEVKQAEEVELRVVHMYETETYAFDERPRPVYQKRGEPPSSMTALCYAHGEEIWIVDQEGLSTQKPFKNIYPKRDKQAENVKEIPKGIYYEYNQLEKIKTEICIPLKSKMESDWTRTAGVLNIESTEMIFPTPHAIALANSTARIIEQLQIRKLAIESADEWAGHEMKEMRGILNSFGSIKDSLPTLQLSVFVARPFGTSSADNIYGWTKKYFESNKIRVLEIDTPGDLQLGIWKAIKSCHFGIVVSTGFNHNDLIEWGYLLGCGKPVIRLHQVEQQSESEPFDIEGTRRFEYAQRGEAPTEDGVCKALQQAMDAMQSSKDKLYDDIKGLYWDDLLP
jgi:hypothetical protein